MGLVHVGGRGVCLEAPPYGLWVRTNPRLVREPRLLKAEAERAERYLAGEGAKGNHCGGSAPRLAAKVPSRREVPAVEGAILFSQSRGGWNSHAGVRVLRWGPTLGPCLVHLKAKAKEFHMTLPHHRLLSAVALLLAVSGCATAPHSRADKDELKASAEEALVTMSRDDPSLSPFLHDAHGYVVFPKVGKGGYIVGGSYGRGVVYEAGTSLGYADITQATVGLQIGGETFMEVLAFESERDERRFQSGKLAFSANVSAVVLKTGAAASARYTDGVAVFVKPIGGAMLEASIGGQQFTYQPE